VETLYEVLGVPKDATLEAIRKAYRQLARKYHPDHNRGDVDKAERFKKIATAHEVLSDDKRRARYDKYGEDSLRRPRRGRDLFYEVKVSLHEAIYGTEVALNHPEGYTHCVRIPPGVETGSRLVVRGKGLEDPAGGHPPGNAVIRTEVQPHPLFRVEGLDLHLAVPVTLEEAYLGATIEVPTFDGNVKLEILPRLQNHAKVRAPGRGARRKNERGDLIIELEVRMPDRENRVLAALLRVCRGAYSVPVRDDLKM
jgi:curved DNA-binding protein